MTNRGALEAAIEADPDDTAAYLVYADWLQAQGDPLGELIVLAHAGKDAAAEQLVAEQRMLGALADFALPETGKRQRSQHLRLTWHLGLVRDASIGWETYSGPGTYDEALEDLTALLELPVARFLRSLEIGPLPASDTMAFESMVERLAELAKPQTLQTVYVGNIGHWDISGTSAGPFDRLLDAYPRLRSLTVHAGDISLGQLEHAELRTLAVQSGGLASETLRELGEARLPKLERLEVWLGTPNYGGTYEVADLRPLLASQGFPALRHLGLMNAVFTDDIVAALAPSRLLPQLETLDLRMGTLTDAGVAAMTAARDRFAHLQLLELDDNALTDASRPLVSGLAKQVNFGDSHEPARAEAEPQNRYSPVGE
jgi:uncharacterized protein (TIGR02996 family)